MYPMRYVSDVPKLLTLRNPGRKTNGNIQIDQWEQTNSDNILVLYWGMGCDTYSEINQKVRYVSDFSWHNFFIFGAV